MFLPTVVADMDTMRIAVCSAYILRRVQLSEVIVERVILASPPVDWHTTT